MRTIEIAEDGVERSDIPVIEAQVSFAQSVMLLQALPCPSLSLAQNDETSNLVSGYNTTDLYGRQKAVEELPKFR